MISRLHISIRGAVQGVGFRPFIYKLALTLKLKGYVKNNSFGVIIEAEGEKSVLDEFIYSIYKEIPPLAFITSLEYNYLDFIGYKKFEIIESEENENPSALIMPDIAVCPDCLHEMNDPSDRRYQYPFINCTNCGPRFSIIEAVPYDRKNTSMKIFQMCPNCKKEYENPLDRRYHAQPIACPDCGPSLEFWDLNGNILSKNDKTVDDCCNALFNGLIICLKGIGGFQLLVDARNYEAVARLRLRKRREEKPFALMFPNLNSVKESCNFSNLEENLLTSTECPIVLLKKNQNSLISPNVAPNNPYIGAMLAYSPLHHLIMKRLQFPIVATSGNISEEPMCIEELEALEKLGGIADYFLVHNRPIVRHVDDSIVRIIAGRKTIIRRARGFAPLPVRLNSSEHPSERSAESNIELNSVFITSFEISDTDVSSVVTTDEQVIMALGADLKNTIALKIDNNVFLSQHIGDLSLKDSNNAFENVLNDFKKLYKAKPDLYVCDSHPDYFSTNYAKKNYLETNYVQHHIAHILSCRTENSVTGEALGVAWDGTGYGLDGTIWGGEFIICDDNSIKHVAQMRQFSLPGGDIAAKEPRRSALGIFYEIFGNEIFDNKGKFQNIILKYFTNNELQLLKQMFYKGFNTFRTSSVGRIFDAVSSLLNILQKVNYEGQAAMLLEFIIDEKERSYYDSELLIQEKLIINWEKIILGIFEDIKNNIPSGLISAKFHNSLVNVILNVAEYFEQKKIILSGGCFQNAYLIEKVINQLENKGFIVYRHQLVPTNDGGIALGQVIARNYEVI